MNIFTEYSSGECCIRLSKTEYLVLFEFIHRFCETGKIALSHHAEAVVLDQIAAELERSLPEPFEKSYPEQLHMAREKILFEYFDLMGKSNWISDLPLEQE